MRESAANSKWTLLSSAVLLVWDFKVDGRKAPVLDKVFDAVADKEEPS